MIIDGKAIAEDIKESLKKEIASISQNQRGASAPRLIVITIGENPVSKKFLRMKKKFASEIGVEIQEKNFKEDEDEKTIIKYLHDLSSEKKIGIMVQLPLPNKYNTQKILDAILPSHDPDMLSLESKTLFKEGDSTILPPVVGAIKEIFSKHNIQIKEKNIVIIGAGELVGKPTAMWLTRELASSRADNTPINTLTICDEYSKNTAESLKNADIIISGVGIPNIIKPEMVGDGVVIIDAGTSESQGKLQGDASPEIAEKASLITPVPGGVGPITVAMLFKNLLILTR